MKRASTLATVLIAAILTGCQDGSGNVTAEADTIAEDPYGATGAPGADMTDNGVTEPTIVRTVRDGRRSLRVAEHGTEL